MSTGNSGIELNRNDPCPCGSGKKFKKCHLGREAEIGLQGLVQADAQFNREALIREATGAHRMGHMARAEELYLQILAARPNDHDAQTNLGIVLGNRGRHLEARAYMTKAAKSDLRQPRYQLNLCTQLILMGHNSEVAQWIKHVLAVDPTNLLAFRLATQALERLSDLEGALKMCGRGLAINAQDAELITMQAGILRRQGELEEARAMLAELVQRDVRPHLLAAAWSELGMVLDKLAQYPAAFEAYEHSASIQRSTHAARQLMTNEWEECVAGYRAAITPELLARFSAQDLEDGNPAPAFLVGFPRSGTTLTEVVLAAHEDIVTSQESPLMEPVKQLIRSMVPDAANLGACLQELSREQILELRALYWKTASEHAGVPLSGRVHLHKHPLQIFDVGLINLIFPEAKVLLALRDPRDCCLSAFAQNFKLTSAMAHFLSVEDTVAFYESALGLWLDLEPKLNIDVLKIRYEDTVVDLEGEVRKMLEFLGLPWNDDVLQYHKKTRGRDITTPSYSGVNEEINTAAVARWKNYEEQLGTRITPLQRFITTFGYES